MITNKTLRVISLQPFINEMAGICYMKQYSFYNKNQAFIWKLFFLFFNRTIHCGYSKEPSQWDGSFEHPIHMIKLMGKKKIQFYIQKFSLSAPTMQTIPNIKQASR